MGDGRPLTIEYNSEDLSDNGKAQLASLQFLEQQMAKLKNEISAPQLHAWRRAARDGLLPMPHEGKRPPITHRGGY